MNIQIVIVYQRELLSNQYQKESSLTGRLAQTREWLVLKNNFFFLDKRFISSFLSLTIF